MSAADRRPLRRLVGLVRVVHPFPSSLDALATGAIALLAGGSGPVAVRLAASMLCLQASIGSLNDLRDAGADAGRKPGKPIPAGLVRPERAAVVVLAAFGAGIALSAPSGAATVLVALAGVALGYAYDLRLSRTPWSWLPLALALPLLPIHAWLGATGALPPGLLALLPVGVVAGAALAVSNALVDLERDRDAGIVTLAVRLGPVRARRLGLVLTALTLVLAAVLLPGGLPAALSAPARVPVLGWPAPPLVLAGALAMLLGAWLGRAAAPAVRERGWEAAAIGVAALGIGWIATVAGLAGS